MKLQDKFSMSELTDAIKGALSPFKYVVFAASLALVGCGGSENDVSGSDGDQEEPGANEPGGPGAGGPTGPSKSAFEEHFYPLVESAACASCHNTAVAAAEQKTPFFADAIPLDAEKYLLASGAVVLNNAKESAIVVKMRSAQLHHCGDEASCASYAEALENGIIEWGKAVQDDPNAYNPLKLASGKSMESELAPGGAARDNTGAIALYEFKDCSNNTALDTSGVAPALNLTVAGGATCNAGTGISFDGQNGSKATATPADSLKVFNAIAGANGSGAFTVEAWVRYGSDDSQGRIFGYDERNNRGNFQLMQNNINNGINLRFNVNTVSNTRTGDVVPFDNNPVPAPEIDSLDHVVITYTAAEGRRMWVNGALVVAEDDIADTALTSWNSATYQLIMGSSANDTSPWEGTIHLAAIYDAALGDDQIKNNFEAGLAPKLKAKFDISELTGTPDTAIEMTVRELDEKGYAFSSPELIAPEGVSLDIPVEGMYIVANGAKFVPSQTFKALNVNLSSLGEGNSNVLHTGGAVVPKSADPEVDNEWFLVFEKFGNESNPAPAINFERKVAEDDGMSTVVNGYKNFLQVRANFSELTGVPQDNPAVAAMFDEIADSLLGNNDLNGFQASHQTNIQKFALEYCDVIANDPAINAQVYPTFDVNNFNADALVNDLILKFLRMDAATTLESMPSFAEIDAILKQEITDLQGFGLSNQNVATTVCATLLGSGLVSVH